jgi:uncharacterized membrane protein YfcA
LESKIQVLERPLEVKAKTTNTFIGKKWGVALLIAIAIIFIIFTLLPLELLTTAPALLKSLITEQLLFFILVGFVAQMIDGALGMAYGVSSTSFLLGLGVPPAMASSSVHVAEVFTSGVSGLSHLKFGNVNKKLFQSLVIPGMLGVVTGAYVLTSIDGKIIKPFMAAYLMIMGIVIIRKAFKKVKAVQEPKKLAFLAVFGGFMDAVGGGGWGPIVASTLISKGHNPRYTIGSVNLAEFFIALAGAGTFIALIGVDNWQIVAGLIVGGTFAAPFAAYLCKKFAPKTLMIMVGVLIICLSLRTIYLAFN